MREFMSLVRGLSWQAMQVRAEETVAWDGGRTAGSSRGGGEQAGVTSGVRAFGHESFCELPESGLDELGAACRAGGLQHLFHAALKLDK